MPASAPSPSAYVISRTLPIASRSRESASTSGASSGSPSDMKSTTLLQPVPPPLLSTSFAFDSAALKSVPPPARTLELIQLSMSFLFASVAWTSVVLYASARLEKTMIEA